MDELNELLGNAQGEQDTIEHFMSAHSWLDDDRIVVSLNGHKVAMSVEEVIELTTGLEDAIHEAMRRKLRIAHEYQQCDNVPSDLSDIPVLEDDQPRGELFEEHVAEFFAEHDIDVSNSPHDDSDNGDDDAGTRIDF